MRKSDLMLVVFIALAGMVISYFVFGMLLGDIKAVSFMTVGEVSAELAEPDPEVFNSAALNPTVETFVGSCVDSDQDGELNLAESVLCQGQAPEDDEAVKEELDDNSPEEAIEDLAGDKGENGATE